MRTWEVLEIPLLYGLAGEWHVHAKLGQDYERNGNRMLFTWWAPDVTLDLEFLARGSHGEVRRHNVSQLAVSFPQEMQRTELSPETLMRKEVADAAPEVKHFLERFAISSQDMVNMSKAVAAFAQEHRLVTSAQQQEAYFKVACEWVRRLQWPSLHADYGQATWTEWIMGATDCPRGSTWSSDTMSCQYCPEGSTAVGGAACAACEAGYYCLTAGIENPVPCPQGRFCPAGSVLPSSCPVGTSNLRVRATDESWCERCAPGRFAAEMGVSACQPCASGKFWHSEGSTACRACVLGAPALGFQALAGTLQEVSSSLAKSA